MKDDSTKSQRMELYAARHPQRLLEPTAAAKRRLAKQIQAGRVKIREIQFASIRAQCEGILREFTWPIPGTPEAEQEERELQDALDRIMNVVKAHA